MRRRLILAAALAAALALAGCTSEPETKGPPGPSPSDYALPPEVTRAVRAAGGTLELHGTALPLARIRLASPDGTATGTAAGADGRWTLQLAGGDAVRLLSLSQDLDGRVVRARGYLALLPASGPPAVMLRPGTGARPILEAVRPPVIGSIEFDAEGAGVVSGRARPNQPIRVFLDGQEAGEGQADGQGWFDVSLSDPLTSTAHSLILTTPDGRAAQAFDATRPGAIETPPFTAERKSAGWRIDWLAPGGGTQTTLVFDPPERGR